MSSDLSKDQILLEQNWCSGKSRKTWLSNLGWGRMCFNVMITDKEIRVTLYPEFRMFDFIVNGNHVIPLRQIKSVVRGRWLWQIYFDISFVGSSGTEEVFRLAPWSAEPFERVLEERGIGITCSERITGNTA